MKQKGTLKPEDVKKVRDNINKQLDERRKMYASLAKVAEQVDNFKQEPNTKILSVKGNTPLHYDGKTEILQSDAVNEMLRNVCAAEFAARNYDACELLKEIEAETGLNYSACYQPLHEAIDHFNKGDPKQLKFLAKQLFKERSATTSNSVTAMFLGQNGAQSVDGNSSKKQLMKRFEQLLEKQDKKEVCDFIKTEYMKYICQCPKFPEMLTAKGFEVFASKFCAQSHAAEVATFEGLSCACPCCMYPKDFTMPNERSLETTVRCCVDGKLIDTADAKTFFIAGDGFCCEAHAAAKVGAKRVVFCW